MAEQEPSPSPQSDDLDRLNLSLWPIDSENGFSPFPENDLTPLAENEGSSSSSSNGEFQAAGTAEVNFDESSNDRNGTSPSLSVFSDAPTELALDTENESSSLSNATVTEDETDEDTINAEDVNDAIQPLNVEDNHLEAGDLLSELELAIESEEFLEIREREENDRTNGNATNNENKPDEKKTSDSLKRKYSDVEDNDANDAGDNVCSICLEPWTTSGEHRVCCLKCGHLFGHECVVTWFRTSKTCPTCKRRAVNGDVRFIYAPRISAIDNSELKRCKNELERVSNEKKSIEMKLNVLKYINTVQQDLIDELNKKVAERLASGGAVVAVNRPDTKLKMSYYKTINLGGKNEPYRSHDGPPVGMVMAFNNDSMIVVSIKVNFLNTVGYGVRKINLDNWTKVETIKIHRDVIKDMKFHPQTNELLLTVSTDKTAIVTNVSNNTKSVFTTSIALWACAWDVAEPNLFYVGGQLGKFLLMDMRQPTLTLKVFETGDMSPVIGLVSVPSSLNNNVQAGTIVCATLTRLKVFTDTSSDCPKQQTIMGIKGPFVSLNYNDKTQRFVLSCRPNGDFVYCRHVYFNLDVDKPAIVANVRNVPGGTVMSQMTRTAQFMYNHTFYMAFFLRSQNQLNVWNCETQSVDDHIAVDNVLDLCFVDTNERCLFFVLTSNELKVYKYERP